MKTMRANLVTDDGEILGSVEVEVLQKDTITDYKGKVYVYTQITKRPTNWDPPDY